MKYHVILGGFRGLLLVSGVYDRAVDSYLQLNVYVMFFLVFFLYFFYYSLELEFGWF